MYGALTYTICMYINIGVKRSVRTSGMQPTILDIPKNCFKGKNGNILIYIAFINHYSFSHLISFKTPRRGVFN